MGRARQVVSIVRVRSSTKRSRLCSWDCLSNPQSKKTDNSESSKSKSTQEYSIRTNFTKRTSKWWPRNHRSQGRGNTKPLAMDFQGLKFSLSLFLRWRKNLLPIDLKMKDRTPQQRKKLLQHHSVICLQHPNFKRFVVYRRKECVKFVAMNKRVLCLFHADILLVVLVALKTHRFVPFVVCEFEKKFDLLLFKGKVCGIRVSLS
ncbi:uncharacterized protein LOC143458977 [Clavelina lepadiformis]|uniref:uncharacterized protein LOC143458977 n=1 Tax=Clavelina lepadiformis TaxID=159417 RepID=UPI004041EAE7